MCMGTMSCEQTDSTRNCAAASHCLHCTLGCSALTGLLPHSDDSDDWRSAERAQDELTKGER